MLMRETLEVLGTGAIVIINPSLRDFRQSLLRADVQEHRAGCRVANNLNLPSWAAGVLLRGGQFFGVLGAAEGGV